MIENLTEAIKEYKDFTECETETARVLRNVGNEKDAKYYEETAENDKKIVAWLTELQERRATDEWISVKERLPDEYGNYLVFTSDNDIDIGTFNPRFENRWSMCDVNGFYWVRQKGIEITHWRPLPKAPESEDK